MKGKKILFPALVILVYIILAAADRQLFRSAAEITWYGTLEMLSVLPPIFILLGLMDVWVPKAVMVRYMGPDSGLRGIATAFFIGSAAAGPLYGAFPVASVLMKKGASFFNILVFIGAWSTTKIPMFLFELQALGAPFALTRLAVNIPGIIIIAKLISSMISQGYIDEIYQKAKLR